MDTRTVESLPISVHTGGLDFSNGGVVYIERYTVNQLIYIGRCMREKKPFKHLIRRTQTEPEVVNLQLSANVVKPEEKLRKDYGEEIVYQTSVTNRKSQGVLSVKTINQSQKRIAEDSNDKSPPEKSSTQKSVEKSWPKYGIVEVLCDPPADSGTSTSTGPVAMEENSLITSDLAEAAASAVSTDTVVVSPQPTPQSDVIVSAMTENTLSSVEPEIDVKFSPSTPSLQTSNTSKSISRYDELELDKHTMEAVVRSLVNAVLVEEEERLARDRGLLSAQNPFASAGLQKYLRGNRDLKVRFLGPAAPSLDAAISPKQAVVSIKATEDVLLKGAQAMSTSSIAKRNTGLSTDKAPIIPTSNASSMAGATSPAESVTFAAVAEKNKSKKSQKQKPSNVIIDSKPQLVPPLKLKISASLIRPQSKSTESTSVRANIPTASANNNLNRTTTHKDQLQHTHQPSIHIDNRGSAHNSKIHDRTTLPRTKSISSTAANSPMNSSGPVRNGCVVAVRRDPIISHTSDARKSNSWDDMKASRLFRQSLLVVRRGSRVAVTKYKTDFVSLPLTYNSVKYAASAITSADEVAARQAQMSANPSSVARDDHENGENVGGRQGHKRSLSKELCEGQGLPVQKSRKLFDQNSSQLFREDDQRLRESVAFLSDKQVTTGTDLPSSSSSGSASVAASAGTTRRGRTVKHNSRLSGYLVGERVLKKCEFEVEKRSRERNRRVEMEYARQWHEIKNQLTTTDGNGQQGQRRDDSEGVSARPVYEGRVLGGSVESFSCSEEDATDSDVQVEGSVANAFGCGNCDVGTRTVPAVVEKTPNDLDNGVEQVILPQIVEEQQEQLVGMFDDELVPEEAENNESVEETIAPVSFALEASHIEFKSRKQNSRLSRSSVPDKELGETLNTSNRRIATWQQKLNARRPVANCKMMREMLLKMETGPDQPTIVKKPQVIIDSNVYDVTKAEMEALTELNTLLYDKPGVVSADQILHDFRKSFCIESRNQIQLIRYKKLLQDRNNQLTLLLRKKVAELQQRQEQNKQQHPIRRRNSPILVKAIRDNVLKNTSTKPTLTRPSSPSVQSQPAQDVPSQVIQQPPRSESQSQQNQQQASLLLQPRMLKLERNQSTGKRIQVFQRQGPAGMNLTTQVGSGAVPLTSIIRRQNDAELHSAAVSDTQISDAFPANLPAALWSHPPPVCPPPPALLVHPAAEPAAPSVPELRPPVSSDSVVPISPIMPAGHIFMMMHPTKQQERPSEEARMSVMGQSDLGTSSSGQADHNSFRSSPCPRVIRKLFRVPVRPSFGLSTNGPSSISVAPTRPVGPVQLVRLMTSQGPQVVRLHSPTTSAATGVFPSGGAMIIPLKQVPNAFPDKNGNVPCVVGAPGTSTPSTANANKPQLICARNSPLVSSTTEERVNGLTKAPIAFNESEGSPVVTQPSQGTDGFHMQVTQSEPAPVDGSSPDHESEVDKELKPSFKSGSVLVTTVSASEPEVGLAKTVQRNLFTLHRFAPPIRTKRPVTLFGPGGPNGKPPSFVRLVSSNGVPYILPSVSTKLNGAGDKICPRMTSPNSGVATTSISTVTLTKNEINIASEYDTSVGI